MAPCRDHVNARLPRRERENFIFLDEQNFKRNWKGERVRNWCFSAQNVKGRVACIFWNYMVN